MTNRFNQWRDSLQTNRLSILYVLILVELMASLASWALLPDVVALSGTQAGMFMEKNMVLLSNLCLTGFFTALFAWKPRELIYFVAACLGILLTISPLLNLLAVS